MDNTRKELITNLALKLANQRKEFSKRDEHSINQWHKDVDITWFHVLKLKANSDEENLFVDTIRNQLKIIHNFKGE